jgi:UPF0716 protein FxsA
MSGLLIFLLLFVGAPLIELYVLIEVGSGIGALPTILLSIFTAVLGGWLVRYQGLSVLFRVRNMLDAGETPALELLEGAVLLVTGLLLLLPGFITDAFGFVMLIPPVRRLMIVRLLRRRGVLRPGAGSPGPDPNKGYIEGEYRRED